MTTLAEIEKAADALPAEERKALVRHLNRTLERQPVRRAPWEVPPPDVPLEELRRIHALIEAEFSQVDPKGW